MGILNKPEIAYITINDCGEPLIELSENDFVLEPKYFEWKFTDNDVIKLRSGVVDRLKKAKKILRNRAGCENWNLKIWDGYRVLCTQKKLYDDYFEVLRGRGPEFLEHVLHEQVQIFVSPPSRDPKLPAPHNTGGTADLTIVDAQGRDLPMGSEFDEFNVRSYINHFQLGADDISEIAEDSLPGKLKPFNQDDCRKFHKNRMLLKDVLEEAGFVNYHEEWWHFSYGDLEWTRQTGTKISIYGSCEL
jgi:D-alanyl-D-alanine dipeptidase